MRITDDWITRPATAAVMRMLESEGHQALFVGGCVRDALLGIPVRDIDIATDAPPENVMALAEAAGLKAVPTGMDHGTVTVISQEIPHEITTFRRDVETFGRRATITHTTDITEDARRRDFTMNALYARADGEIVDPLGGLPDLRARRVRFVGIAEERIREDYLRILRFFRLHAWYGRGEPDPEGLAACARLADGLEQLSRERIGAEMLKLLAAPDPARVIAAMDQAGVLDRILPGASGSILPRLLELERTLDIAPDPIRRLAALGGDDVSERLRLSNARMRRLAVLSGEATTERSAAELGYRFGSEPGRDILLLRCAREGGPIDEAALCEVERGAKARFPLRANDLMPRYEGPALGAKLRDLEEKWIESGFSLAREDLLG